ncbi:hypothetical protein J1605_022334 [Eschrichtius robustus]|uniref:Uncharacterized protein n=1 Tax=Eschrichtius robustus TaxID=9764 RepID=A0AB34H9T3_ESCRO|nr:hypothetical protein J1605_022334 [Eschrichtius robustus]
MAIRRRRYYLLTPGRCPAAQCLQWAESPCGAVTPASSSYATHNNQDRLGLLHRDDHVKGPWRAQGWNGQAERRSPIHKEVGLQEGSPKGLHSLHLSPWVSRGGLSSFMHRPGPLERRLHAKSSEDISNMKFQPSCMSSYWKRHHRHIQLHPRFPTSAEEGSCRKPLTAAPDGSPQGK